MAVTTHTLTGDFGDLVGGDLSSIRAWIETNIPEGALTRLDTGGQILLGDSPLDLDEVAAFTIDLVATDSADINPTLFQYRVYAEYRKASGREMGRWDSGWFDLTADTDLKDVIASAYVPPSYLSSVLSQLQGFVDDAEAAADRAEAATLTDLNTSDGQVAFLLGATTSATRPAAVAVIEDEFMPFVLMGVI